MSFGTVKPTNFGWQNVRDLYVDKRFRYPDPQRPIDERGLQEFESVFITTYPEVRGLAEKVCAVRFSTNRRVVSNASIAARDLDWDASELADGFERFYQGGVDNY